MANTDQVTVKIDNKGRVTLPKNMRKALGVEIGDTIFLKLDPGDKQLCLAPAINPFDILAKHAIEEYREGRTKTIEEFARERNIPNEL